jgi:hypothetical protein
MTVPAATVAYFARPDDDYGLRAIAVTASAEDSAYPALNLIAENAADPAKLTTTTGNWVLQFSSAIQPLIAILYYQYLDAGLSVKLQANSSNSWGAPPFEQAFTIPAKRRDGPTNQFWTNNVGMVISGSPSYAYWRLVIVGTNSQVVAVGRLVLLTAYHAVKLLSAEGLDEDDAPEGQIVQPTELGVETVYTIGGPRRRFSGSTPLTDKSGIPLNAASELRALHEGVEGQAHPFILFPFGLTGEPWLVRFESATRTRHHSAARAQYWPFAVREVSRGLPWP